MSKKLSDEELAVYEDALEKTEELHTECVNAYMDVQDKLIAKHAYAEESVHETLAGCALFSMLDTQRDLAEWVDSVEFLVEKIASSFAEEDVEVSIKVDGQSLPNHRTLH